jgi:hypothetical protein
MIKTEHPELGEAYDLAEPIIRAIAPHENNFECAADTPRTSEFYREWNAKIREVCRAAEAGEIAQNVTCDAGAKRRHSVSRVGRAAWGRWQRNAPQKSRLDGLSNRYRGRLLRLAVGSQRLSSAAAISAQGKAN